MRHLILGRLTRPVVTGLLPLYLCVCVCVCVCVHRACYSAHVCGTTSLANCRRCSKRKRVSHLLTNIANYQVRKCLNSVMGPVLPDLKYVKIANKNIDFARTSNMPCCDLHSTSCQLQCIIMETREMTLTL